MGLVPDSRLARFLPFMLAAILFASPASAWADEGAAEVLRKAQTSFEHHLADRLDPSKYQQALVDAAAAVDAAPTDPRSHLLLGSVYLRHSANRLALEHAEDSFLTALDLAPGDIRARTLLAETYFLQRRFHSARQVLLGLLVDNVPNLAPSFVAQALRAYLLNGDLELGLGEVPELRRRMPDNPWLAALHAGLLSAKARNGADARHVRELRDLRSWWQRPGLPADLAAFVRGTWLKEG